VKKIRYVFLLLSSILNNEEIDMRKPIIAGNWKMNKTIKEALELTNGLKRELIDIEEARIVLAPPATALSCVGDALLDSNIDLSAQNVHSEISGAYTGEISVLMAKDAGCKYTIIGHSERRKYFGEDNSIVNQKIDWLSIII